MLLSKKVNETIVGKDEAGLFEFNDTGVAIEMGDKAFTLQKENSFSGTVDTVYFKHRENADSYLWVFDGL